MFLRKSLLSVAGIVLAGGMGAFAQEAQSQKAPAQDGTFQKDRIERMERHRERMGKSIA